MTAQISRRGFLKGAGLAGLAAGAGALGAAAAQDVPQAMAAEEEALYTTIFPQEMSSLPVDKGTWDIPEGIVGFEDRDIPAEEIGRVEDFDVVVLGGGISGLVAAKKAAAEGARVLVVEKMNKGRSTWESIGGWNSTAQQKKGSVPDPTEYVEILMRAGYNRVPADIMWAFVNRSGETIDFVQAMLDEVESGIEIYSTDLPPYPFNIDLYQGEHKFNLPEEYNWTSWMFGPPVMHQLEKNIAEDSSIEERFLTSAVQLVMDNNRAIGAIVKDKDGYYQVNGAKGVILATGSYNANPKLMAAWVRPEDFVSSGTADPSRGVTGDGHLMGLAVGASMDPVPHTVMNFGVPLALQVGFGVSCVVGPHGKRFMNEAMPLNWTSNAINTECRRGGKCFYILDAAMMSIQRGADPTTDDNLEAMKAAGTVVEGATLADLAGQIGCDAVALEETVRTWNSYFEADAPKDTAFGRDLSACMPIGEGPYFAGQMKSMIYAVVSGLTINEHSQVLDTQEQVIEGLYACGNAAGSMFAGTYPRHLPATSVGRAATFGLIAGEHVVKGA